MSGGTSKEGDAYGSFKFLRRSYNTEVQFTLWRGWLLSCLLCFRFCGLVTKAFCDDKDHQAGSEAYKVLPQAAQNATQT